MLQILPIPDTSKRYIYIYIYLYNTSEKLLNKFGQIVCSLHQVKEITNYIIFNDNET